MPELQQPAIVEDRDAVGVADGRETVRHDDRGATGHEPGQRLLDQALGLVVERAGGLVEDEDGRVLEDGPGDGDALALAA